MTQHLLKNSFLRGVLFLLLCAVGLGNAWGEEVTVTFDASKQGYTNAQDIKNVTITDGITVTFDKGTNSNTCKYYNTGTAIRVYGGGYFTISSTIGNITKIVFTFSSGEDSNEISKNCGTYYSSTGTWEGSSESITFTIGGTKGHRRIKTITVTYQTSTTPDAPTPELESIDFEAADNIEYYVGETVNEKDLTVTANYTNGTNADVTKDVENWTFTPGTINSINDNSISVEFDYAGKTYNTYSFNITVKSIANTAESAYSVAQACTLIDAGKGLAEEVHVKGIISKIDSYNSTYKSITYWISEDGTTTGQQFECYSGKNKGGADFTSIDDLKIGASVVIKGLLKKYNSIYEFDKNNEIVTYDDSNALTLTSIEVNGTPSKTSYYIGDTPSAAGLTVYAVYSDDSKVDVTDNVTWTFNRKTFTEEGNIEVTATAEYQDKSVSHVYSVIVVRNPKITDYTKLEDGKKYYIVATLSNGTDYYFSTTYTNIVEAVKGVAQTDKVKANILTAIAHSSESNKWAFQFENGYYLSLKDSQDNGKVRIIAQKTYWVLSNTTKGLINMTTNGFCLQRNNSTTTTNFGSYSNTQTNIWFLEVPTYDVEISSAGLATFCLPYNATIPDGLTAYTATDKGKSVILTAKVGGKIAAGEGMVLKGNEGTYTFVAAEGSVNPTAENQMVGVTEDTKLTADKAYMLTRKIDDGSIAFRLLKTDYTLGANKAYLKASNTANIRELIPALWDDNATGIDNIAKDEVTATGAIYNLAGQKLMRAQKGINIINGKLVIK